VEVEVVLREVREHRDGPVDRVGAVQLERVRAGLHRAGHVARLEHPGEGRLQVDGLGRGVRERGLLAADDALDRPEERGRPARGLEQLAHEERGGRLAVRPGHADDVQPRRRIAVEAGGDARHRDAHVVDDHLRHAQAERALDDQRRGTARDRVGRELMPVAGEAGHAEEERPGPDEAVVEGEPGDVHRGQPFPCQHVELHGPQSRWRAGHPAGGAGSVIAAEFGGTAGRTP